MKVECPRCLGELRMMERRGMLELFACQRCGLEQWTHATPPEPSQGPVLMVRVVVKWNAPPSPQEIVALRHLAPELAGLPASELLQKVKQAPEYEVGVFMPGKAEEVIARGRKLGLVLERR
jgi:hypothetical protein